MKGLIVETIVSKGWPEDQAALENADAIVIYSDGNDEHVARGVADVLSSLYQNGVGFAVLHYALEPGEAALDDFGSGYWRIF